MRALLFDFGGTLDSPRHWLDRFVDHYQAAGVAITRRELDPAFDYATRLAYRSTVILRGRNLVDLLRFLVETQLRFLDTADTPLPAPTLRQLRAVSRSDLVERIVATFAAETAAGLAQSRVILERLARRFTLGIVSNFYGNLDRVLADAGFGPLLHAIADSANLGLYKPDLRLYRAALAMIEVAPPETAMVGDSLSKDCAPARQLGLKSVWLRHQGADPNRPDAHCADFTIAALQELEDLRWDPS